jgi:integrase
MLTLQARTRKLTRPLQGLRHTHASQLIASGVDIVTISKRLGHAKPSVTLAIYAHMFHRDDSKAAQVGSNVLICSAWRLC